MVVSQIQFLCKLQELSNRKGHKEGAKHAENGTNSLYVPLPLLSAFGG